MYLITEDLFAEASFAFSMYIRRKYKIINDLLVETAGVEPAIGTENTQVTDTKNA
jgi:hypothetical protein